MLIDTHAHLADHAFDQDRDEVIDRARSAGITDIVAVSYDLESARKTLELVRRYDWIYPALGIHPNISNQFKGDYEKEFWALFDTADMIAVGEVGLDYYRDASSKEDQLTVLYAFLEKAQKLGLPLIIHNRMADEDILSAVSAYPKGALKGVFHCFSGSAGFAKKVTDLGFYISIAGQITFPGAGDLRNAVSQIPIEKMILETDAPYLAPQKKRGKRNEPSYMVSTADELGRLKGLSRDDVCRITTFNAKRLFGIGSIEDAGRITYKIRDSLYLNITNSCTNACVFCIRYFSDYVKGHNLKLKEDPSYEEIVSAIKEAEGFKEAVFCGYGEPLIRLDIVKRIAAYLKSGGIKVRIDTNGHGNLIHGRSIVSELEGLVDEISISLNADTTELYGKICQPVFGPGTFEEVKKFIVECKAVIPNVSVTVVGLKEIDLNRVEKIAKEELGVPLRVRQLNEVG
ncbi:TatD family hydrolase [Candidatus Auribacterota bacterium]